MPRKSKASKSRAKNLGKHAQKKPSVTVEEIPEEENLNHRQEYQPDASSKEPAEYISEEGIITYNQDGSFTLQGFLDYFEKGHDQDLADSDSDSNEESEIEQTEDYPEIKNLSDLETFTKVLIEAQRIGVEVENERLKDSNRPKTYLKNSARTKCHQAKGRRDLEKQGYLSIKTRFSKQKNGSGFNKTGTTDTAADSMEGLSSGNLSDSDGIEILDSQTR